MKNIYVIGAGQLGSRHLQALKTVNQQLNITVVDPNLQCLDIAKQRYEAMENGKFTHCVSYTQKNPISAGRIDLVIIATNADVRKQVIIQILQIADVKFMVLEKLLFQKSSDYKEIQELLVSKGVKVWVNCSMRTMPFYHLIKQEIKDEKVFYHVSGGQFGLVTNAIHYLDHLAYLTENLEFRIDTSLIDTMPITSKRKGFFELNGTLNAFFSKGSQAVITCYPDGNAPMQIQIISRNIRIIVREAEGRAWVAKADKNWEWTEVDARIPYQSEMTATVTNRILEDGECNLVQYEDSTKVHLNLLDPLLDFLNHHQNTKSDLYPFT